MLELADSASTDIMKLSESATSLDTNYQCTKEEWQKLFDEFTELRKVVQSRRAEERMIKMNIIDQKI